MTAWPNSGSISLRLALSTVSERGGAVAGNPSSDSLQYDVKERLSRHPLDHHIDIFFVSSKAADTERVCRRDRPAKQRKNSAEIGIDIVFFVSSPESPASLGRLGDFF